MKLSLFILLTVLMGSTSILAQGPDTVWTRTYGGTADEDHCAVVISVGAGGYAFGGVTRSYGAGSADMWLIRTDDQGNTVWTRTYGGNSSDDLRDMVDTQAGGFAMVAGSYLDGGYQSDVRLIITDALGNTLHDVSFDGGFGGAGNDYGHAIVALPDGGFALAGRNELGVHEGPADFWLIRTDSAGDSLWSRTYGGGGNDICWDIARTTDGGFVLAGWTNSFGAGGYDLFLVRTDGDGNTLWTRTFGGAGNDGWPYGVGLATTFDGGFVVTSYTESFGTGGDVYLVRTDANGNALWTNAFGGSLGDRGSAVARMADGGFAVFGTSDIAGPPANFYLARTNADGQLLWSRTYGGPQVEDAAAGIITADGGFVLAGMTNSFGAGSSDFYVVKTAPDPTLCDTLSGTLGAAGSPYFVACDLLLPAGDTLVIEPGVVLNFMGPYKFEVRGTLLAQGTEEDSIVFTTDTLANPGRWRGLRFYHGSNDASELGYCIVEHVVNSTWAWPEVYGAIWVDSASPAISHTTVRHNYANRAGGIGATGGSLVRVSDCVFLDNGTDEAGGAIEALDGGYPTVERCLFVGNYALNNGGAIGIGVSGSGANFNYCIFRENSCEAVGSALALGEGTTVVLNHCTMFGNTSGNGQIGAFSGCDLTLRDCIVAAGNGSALYCEASSFVSVGYTDFYGNPAGVCSGFCPPSLGQVVTTNRNGDPCDQYYNIFLDPQFVNSTGGDFHLTANSPCIDAGDPTLYDPDCTISDIGAYFYYHLAQPESLVVWQDGSAMAMCWSVVDSTDCAAPSPIRSYVIYYEEEVNENWDFLAVTTDTCYRHEHVLPFSPPSHYYEVVATDYEPAALNLIVESLGGRPTREELTQAIRMRGR